MEKVAIGVKVVGVLLIVLLILICGLYLNHQLKLKSEKNLYQPLGRLVKVNGKNMSIYAEGSGSTTIVFLSGSGTCSPILDFKSLYSLLSDEYRIVVVERFGYGFSDISNTNRDIDTVLENTRQALKEAGIIGPYIICAHSMSGIEALHWAQQYPTEVSGIIGLDMAVPEAYQDLKINPFAMKVIQFLSNIGATRIGNFADGSAIKGGTLTDEEQDIYRAVFYRRTMTADMISEAENIRLGSEKVNEKPLPRIPVLSFCTDGSDGTGFSTEEWKRIQNNFSELIGSKIIYLDCGHYAHNYKYNEIAAVIKYFLRDIGTVEK